MNAIFTFPFRRPALFFLIWAGWLSLEYWALGPFSYLFIHDNADQVIPFMTWLTRSPLALWRDPLVPVVSGLDRFSSTAWLVAHQPFLMTLPLWLGHGVFIALQRFLAGYFTYRFLREGLRLPPAVGLLAGLAYTLIQAENGELRMMHVFNEPGLPVLLWGFSCIPARPWKAAVPRYVLISLMIGLGMGPVDAMPFFIPVAWLVGWILRDDTRNIRGWLSYTAWITATCLLALPWKIPGIQALLANAEISHRVDWVNGLGWSDAIWHLLPGRVGWLAGWWLPLLLSLAWVVPFWRWRRRADLASLLLLFAGVALGTLVQVVVYVKSADLGIFKGINWFRFDRIGPLALLIAAGMGVRRMFYAPWEEANWQPGRLLVLGLLGGLIVHESWTVKQSHLAAVKTGQHWRALFDNADVKRLASSQRGKPLRVVTAAANHEYHAMYNLAYGLECADGYAVLYPERYQRYWREVVRPLLTREPGLAGHFTWGSRAYLYHGQSPVNASVAAIPFADWYNLDLLSLANVGQVISRKPVNDPRLVRVPPEGLSIRRQSRLTRPCLRKPLRTSPLFLHAGVTSV
jgi:hypothetical protein